MNRLTMQTLLCLAFCPLLAAQQPTQTVPAVAAALPAQAIQISGTLHVAQDAQRPVEEQPLAAADLDRGQILKDARTIVICSETDFLKSATLDRALMRQTDWDKLGLSIVSDTCYDNPRASKPRTAELKLQIDRIVFTHIHTYVLTERATGVVLASGQVRAIDGVVASGPMAEQIVKVLAAARVQGKPASGE